MDLVGHDIVEAVEFKGALVGDDRSVLTYRKPSGVDLFMRPVGKSRRRYSLERSARTSRSGDGGREAAG